MTKALKNEAMNMSEFLYWALILINITIICGIILMAIYGFTIFMIEEGISLTTVLKRIRKRSWEDYPIWFHVFIGLILAVIVVLSIMS